MMRARATARAAVTPGRVAVVTGAGSGIGLAVSLALVARGAHVVGVGRRREALERARELAGGPGQLDVVTADVASSGDREAVASHVRQLVSQGSTLEWLVHNAGVLGEVGPPSAVTEEGFRSTMAINVEGPLFLTQALSGELAAAPDGGRVLHVSSGAAYAPLDGWLSYCTSKAALLQLMRCLDKELQPKVRVGSMMPGVVDTPMQASIRTMDFPAVEYFRGLEAQKPGGAWSKAGKPPQQALDKPENVADFILWLLGDVSAEEFGGKEWDINDPEQQRRWLSTRR